MITNVEGWSGDNALHGPQPITNFLAHKPVYERYLLAELRQQHYRSVLSVQSAHPRPHPPQIFSPPECHIPSKLQHHSLERASIPPPPSAPEANHPHTKHQPRAPRNPLKAKGSPSQGLYFRSQE